MGARTRDPDDPYRRSEQAHPIHVPNAFQTGDLPVLAQMMSFPLTISSILHHAARHHPESEVVSRMVEGGINRYTYVELEQRARRVADAFAGLGVARGQRIGSLAWNTHRHLELYYGIGGGGAVIHTINPRLHPDQIAWIIGHAEDQYLAFDLTFVPIIEAIASKCPTVKGWIALTDRANMPATDKIPNLMCYEELVDSASPDYRWPALDENSAVALCYTSGTTGNPKGVLYSHRSSVLHAYAAGLPDAMGLSARDAVLPVVPMFHVNAWGLPYTCPLVGAKLVMPGPALDGKSVYELMEEEKVTFAAGVPTVWLGLLQHVQQNGLKFHTLRRTVIGGSACPPAMIRAFRDEFDVKVIHAWGMTELSPLGSLCHLQAKHDSWSEEAQQKLLEKQGHVVYGIDLKIVDDDNKELP